jgi:hypothetical protein
VIFSRIEYEEKAEKGACRRHNQPDHERASHKQSDEEARSNGYHLTRIRSATATDSELCYELPSSSFHLQVSCRVAVSCIDGLDGWRIRIRRRLCRTLVLRWWIGINEPSDTRSSLHQSKRKNEMAEHMCHHRAKRGVAARRLAEPDAHVQAGQEVVSCRQDLPKAQ